MDAIHRNLYRTEAMLINEVNNLWDMIVCHHEINTSISQDAKQFLMIDFMVSV